MKYFLLLTTALLLVTTTDADAVRRRRAEPTVDSTPAPAPVCTSLGVRVDCITMEPLPEPPEEPEEPADQPSNQVVVTVTEPQNTEYTPNPVDLPLDLRHHTLREFNDSRVAELHQQVGVLVGQAVNAARRPFTVGRNPSLVDEIQSRLDLLADGANPNRPIDYYWMVYFPDRTVVYVKPMRNLHILTYTIMTGTP